MSRNIYCKRNSNDKYLQHFFFLSAPWAIGSIGTVGLISGSSFICEGDLGSSLILECSSVKNKS